MVTEIGVSLDHVLPAFFSALTIQRYDMLLVNDDEERSLISGCCAVRRGRMGMVVRIVRMSFRAASSGMVGMGHGAGLKKSSGR